jgi:phospholipase C
MKPVGNRRQPQTSLNILSHAQYSFHLFFPVVINLQREADYSPRPGQKPIQQLGEQMSARKISEGAVLRRGLRIGTVGALALMGITTALVADAGSQAPAAPAPAAPATATPIQHLVVIFQENISYDHYFGTYPSAANVTGEPSFTGQAGTPTSNNYLSNSSLLTANPNTNSGNGSGAANPFRLDRTQAATEDQDHNYTPEQQAADNGRMDLFPKNTGTGTPGGVGAFGTTGQVMGYFDGNTVTALWNYAQGFSMSDNSFGDQYGPSTPGALNVVSGETNGMNRVSGTSTSYFIADGQGGFSEINDADPAFDTCSILAAGNDVNYPGNRSVGDLLTAANITWGGFAGGFNLSITNANGTTGCARSTVSAVTGVNETDFIQHHDWFQYFPTTVNANHTRPTSLATIGTNGDPANHEYDIQDFFAAVSAGNFPAVSYIKMPAYQDGHAGYSDPLDEQNGIVTLINFLEHQPTWSSTAVIIAYDDSDGWYDHVFMQPTSSSFNSTADQLNGAGVCANNGNTSQTQQNGVNGKPVNGRCGPGPRLPFLVISPWSKQNNISHVQIAQASVIRFIEDNWLSGQRLGEGSFDATDGSIMDQFNFTNGGNTPRIFLYPASGLRLRTLTHDFADSGFSGVAWRDTSGNVGMWLMNGSQISQSSVIGNVTANWTLVGQQVLNNSGASDLIWRDTSGNLGVWFMNGSQIVSSAVLGNVPTNWTLAGTAPFGGLGAELFWRDNLGNVGVWVLNGTQVVSSTVLGNVGTQWSIVGTGDFTGTGNTGLLWRDTSGNVAIWLMNGTQVVSSTTLGNVPTNWTVAGTGDFNGDGTTDIVWQDTSGNIGMWLMNGTTITSASVLGNVGSSWSIAETGDFNGDGMSDILLRDNAGNVGMWLMNGSKISTASVLGNVPTIWQVQSANAE